MCHLQEVGEDSKIARSFERIKSIIAKNKRKKKELIEKKESEKNLRLEELVREVVAHKNDFNIQETSICNSPRDFSRLKSFYLVMFNLFFRQNARSLVYLVQIMPNTLYAKTETNITLHKLN